MESNKKSKIEIIEEISNFYNLTNRGIINGQCTYESSTTGNKCAIGRYMIDTSKLVDETTLSVIDLAKSEGTFDKLLKPEYKGHDKIFWNELQNFHDSTYNFTKTGLSEIGKLEKLKLIERWK